MCVLSFRPILSHYTVAGEWKIARENFVLSTSIGVYLLDIMKCFEKNLKFSVITHLECWQYLLLFAVNTNRPGLGICSRCNPIPVIKPSKVSVMVVRFFTLYILFIEEIDQLTRPLTTQWCLTCYPCWYTLLIFKAKRLFFCGTLTHFLPHEISNRSTIKNDTKT